MFDVKAAAAPSLPTHDRAANDSRRTGFSREGVISREGNVADVLALSRLKPLLRETIARRTSA